MGQTVAQRQLKLLAKIDAINTANKGWRNEPARHSLSAMGIKTGTKKSYIMNAKKGYFGEPKKESLKLVGHEKEQDIYQDDEGNTYAYKGNSKADWDEFSKNYKKYLIEDLTTANSSGAIGGAYLKGAKKEESISKRLNKLKEAGEKLQRNA